MKRKEEAAKQYFALKAWPSISVQNELEKLGLIQHPLSGRIVAMDLNQPMCEAALREYEEAEDNV